MLFSFGISNWEYFSKKSQLEKVIVDKQFTSKLNFVDEIIKNVSNLPADSNNKTIDLVITSLLIPGNHYSWNSKDRKGIIISKGILDQQFQGDNNVNKMIVKVIQRMLVYSKEINELKAHLDSHGCLFDYNVRIKELETVVEMNYLCDECIDKILKEKNGKEAYKKISEWIDNNV